MLEFATASQNLPFAIVLALLVAIFVIELGGFMFGANVGGLLGDVDLPDADVDVSPEALNLGFVTSFLYWLNIGRIPVIILIVVFMTAFVMSGYVLQLLVLSLGGFLLPAYLAALAAVAASIPLVRLFGRTVAKIIPRDETEAVSTAELVGSRAVIILGTAKTGSPAQARATDRFGATHYMMLEPDDPQAVLESGKELLLVRYDGSKFYAINHPEP